MTDGRAPSSSAGRSAEAEGLRARREHGARRRLARALVPGGMVLAGLAWWTGWGGTGARGAATALAIVGVTTAAALAVRPRGDPARWARGAAGEVATAALLDTLAGRQWAVFHDLALPGSRANVDHLVIGPTGVWVIDSKAYRARLHRRWGRLYAGRTALSTRSVRWEAEVVSGLLGERARPLVAVHGEGLPRRGSRCAGVRVLPADMVVRRLRRHRRLRRRLSPGRARELAARALECWPPRRHPH